MTAYYNEVDRYAAQWLRNLIAAGHIPGGHVDERSIVDVRPADIAGYTQCHFFAGIAGWGYALRLAGWPDSRPIWTGSCPCQPYSVAGKGEGQADPRDLWPAFARLIRACRPSVVMGEQVAAAVGKDWLDRVCVDLESIGYACGAAVIPACAVDAPHRRDRLWFVGDASRIGWREGWSEPAVRGGRSTAALTGGPGGAVGDADASGPPIRVGGTGDARTEQPAPIGTGRGSAWPMEHAYCAGQRIGEADHTGRGVTGQGVGTYNATVRAGGPSGSAWGDFEWIAGADGKARRVKPGVRLLAHGVPARVGRLRAYGNAIVPQVAAEVIASFMDYDIAEITL